MIIATWVREFLGLPLPANTSTPSTTTQTDTSSIVSATSNGKPAGGYAQQVRATLFDQRTNVPVEWISVKDSIQQKLLFNPRFSDVTFVFEESKDEKIPAHRQILASRSEVFRAMFYNGFAESQTDEKNSIVIIRDIQPHVFRTMIRCMYTDVIKPRFSADNVFDLLQCAKVFQFHYLSRRCVRWLTKTLTPGAACGLLGHSRGMLDEEKLVLKCIEANCSEAFESEEFLRLPKSSVAAILASDSLYEDEICIFQALVKWTQAQLEHDFLPDTPANRQMIAADLIPLIRFPHMTVQDIAIPVSKSGLLTVPQLLELFNWFGNPIRPKLVYSTQPRVSVMDFVKWDPKYTHPFLKLSEKNTIVEFIRSSSEVEASGGTRPEVTQRSLQPLTTGTYSVRMSHTSGWIYSVGICTPSHLSSQQLGTTPHSWSYQYSGTVRGSGGVRVARGFQSYGANVVNVHVDTMERTVGFSVDSQPTQLAFRSLPNQPFYLAVSLGWPGAATILSKPSAAGASLPLRRQNSSTPMSPAARTV